MAITLRVHTLLPQVVRFPLKENILRLKVNLSTHVFKTINTLNHLTLSIVLLWQDQPCCSTLFLQKTEPTKKNFGSPKPLVNVIKISETFSDTHIRSISFVPLVNQTYQNLEWFFILVLTSTFVLTISSSPLTMSQVEDM